MDNTAEAFRDRVRDARDARRAVPSYLRALYPTRYASVAETRILLQEGDEVAGFVASHETTIGAFVAANEDGMEIDEVTVLLEDLLLDGYVNYVGFVGASFRLSLVSK
jgi:hypothetical protein